MHGGATFKQDDGAVDVGLRAVVVSGSEFVSLVKEGVFDSWLSSVVSGRTILVLLDAVGSVNKQWAANGPSQDEGCVSEDALHSTLTGVMVKRGVEYALCRTDAEASEFIVDLAVCIAKAPYREEVRRTKNTP